MAQAADSARIVIMTVDDDPGVSRAVARYLRRRYGASYRIVRAESGESALDALRELKLRGDLVAVILADYRMPRMNGIEFLEEALDVCPGARRVLLTAYADTNAAINVVDLDHCLLKPWDPPEEKLYPVLDDLLRAWRSSDLWPVPSTKVVGHRWSSRSSDVREFLARNQVAYRWYSADEPEGRRLPAAAGEDGRRLPVVVTPDGTPLVEPEAVDLAARVGLATTPTADSAGGQGTLTVRTASDHDRLLVEFRDRASGFRHRTGGGSSIPSSPPSRWVRGPGSGSTSPGGSWSTSTTGASRWSRSRAPRVSRYCFR